MSDEATWCSETLMRWEHHDGPARSSTSDQTVPVSVSVPTLLVVKLTRLLFDVQIRWLYIVAAVVFVVGAVVLVRRSRAPGMGAQ